MGVTLMATGEHYFFDVILGFAYVMNKLDFHLVDDPREKALREAVYRGIARARS